MATDRRTRPLLRAALLPALASALLLAASCSRAPGASWGADARDAAVAQAEDLGLGLGSGRGSVNAAALSSGKSVAEKELDAIAGGSAGADQSRVPGPDDWRIITSSLGLFRHAPYVADMVLGLGASILVALVLTSSPRRSARFDPVARAEVRKAIVVCALIGCIAAELVQASEKFLLGAEIALVLFGIGGLVRFRTLFDDAGQTGIAIVATVLGLACGMSEYSLAALALSIVYLVNWWMSSVGYVQVRVRARKHQDLAQVQSAVAGVLQAQQFSVLRSNPNSAERTLEVYASSGAEFDAEALQAAIAAAVPGSRVRVKCS